jgi:hypothetical protein
MGQSAPLTWRVPCASAASACSACSASEGVTPERADTSPTVTCTFAGASCDRRSSSTLRLTGPTSFLLVLHLTGEAYMTMTGWRDECCRCACPPCRRDLRQHLTPGRALPASAASSPGGRHPAVAAPPLRCAPQRLYPGTTRRRRPVWVTAAAAMCSCSARAADWGLAQCWALLQAAAVKA